MFDPLESDFAPPQQQSRGPRPLLRFFSEPAELPGKSAEAGRPIYEDRDYVGITNPGSRDEVVRLVKDKAKQDEYVSWAYKRWKATQEQHVEGTPLETVPFVGKAQVMELKAMNIHTLEHLAEMPDTVKQRIMGGTDLAKRAKAYLETAGDMAAATKLQHELTLRDKEIEALRKQVTDMSEKFAAAMKDK